MPRPYSGDLRRRVIAAALEGSQSRDEVARRFAVGRSSVYRWIGTAQSEGRLEAKPMRGGPEPVIRDETEAALRDLVKAENHLTQGYRIWSRTSFQRVVIGSGPAVQRWEGRLKGHIKLGHAYQEANLTRASSRER